MSAPIDPTVPVTVEEHRRALTTEALEASGLPTEQAMALASYIASLECRADDLARKVLRLEERVGRESPLGVAMAEFLKRGESVR